MAENAIRIFLGYDEREAAGFHVCVQSLIETCSVPFHIIPVRGPLRDGTTAFTYSRFLVPEVCGHSGWALFADGSDMLFLRDAAALWALRDERYAVQVVKHNYRTRQHRKYIGTAMEDGNPDYERKNWSSLMLFNCGHQANLPLTSWYIAAHDGPNLHRFGWLADDEIGALPAEWNVLIGEDGEYGECAIAHFTLGIPSMPHYRDCHRSKEWWATVGRMWNAT